MNSHANKLFGTAPAIPQGGYVPPGLSAHPAPPAVVRPMRDIQLCSGFGKFHSDNPEVDNRRAYVGVTLSGIHQMMINPQAVAKDDAQWVIFSDYKNEYGRGSAEQRQHGQYFSLWADIDDAKGVTCNEITNLAWAFTGGAETWVYASRSATEDNQRSRIIIPLSVTVTADEFELLQEVLNNKLAGHLLIPDRANESCSQICFLPNKGEFYTHHQGGGNPFNPEEWASEVAALKAEREKARAEAVTRQAESKARMILLRKGQDFLPREACNDAYDSHDLWLVNGGVAKSGGRVLSPHSSSGSAAITFANDGTNKWTSRHGSDVAQGIGRRSDCGSYCFGDAFDLICFFEHGNDETKAAAVQSNDLDPVANKARQVSYAIEKQDSDVRALFAEGDLARLAATSDKPVQASNSEFDLPPLPVELQTLPDGLGDIQQYIYGMMTYPCLATAGWAAIATMTAFVQTKHTIDSRGGLGFNEYYLTLAKTGFGKEELRDPVNQLVAAIPEFANGLPSIETAAPSSRQGLHQLLENAPAGSVYAQSDEFAEWLKMALKDANKQQALAYIMEIYSKALRTVHPGAAVTQQYQPVKNPRLSIFATTTAESVLNSMSLAHAEMGAYNRFVIYVAPEQMPEKRYTGLVYTPSKGAIDAVKWVCRLKPTKVTFGKAAFAEFIANDKAHAEPIKFQDGLMGGRLSEQAIKLAGLFALSGKRTEISAEDITLAYKIRLGLYQRTSAMIEQSGAISGAHETTKALDQVRELVKKNSGNHKATYISQLPARSRAYSALHLNERNAVIRTLIEQGEIAYHPDNHKLLITPSAGLKI